jgi:cyclopropane fatty-acyl-phospholipid synthase-like methyltransferase
MKPYAPACDENRGPILKVLSEHFADRRLVLEIGSGTGQHAVYFASSLPHLVWQPTDLVENHVGINAWLNEAGLPNTRSPLVLDVTSIWPDGVYDAVFSANTLHILAWEQTEQLFEGLPHCLTEDAKLVIYGPFNYGGRYTSDSNARFDRWLKAQAPHQGVRDFEAVDALARKAGFALLKDHAMPANNRCLIWDRSAVSRAV